MYTPAQCLVERLQFRRFVEHGQMLVDHVLVVADRRSGLRLPWREAVHFRRGLVDQREQDLERDPFFTQDIIRQGIDVVDEVASEHGREVQMAPFFGWEETNIPRDGPGELFQDRPILLAVGLQEEGNITQVYPAALAERLQRIQDTPACGDRLENGKRHTAGRVDPEPAVLRKPRGDRLQR